MCGWLRTQTFALNTPKHTHKYWAYWGEHTTVFLPKKSKVKIKSKKVGEKVLNSVQIFRFVDKISQISSSLIYFTFLMVYTRTWVCRQPTNNTFNKWATNLSAPEKQNDADRQNPQTVHVQKSKVLRRAIKVSKFPKK